MRKSRPGVHPKRPHGHWPGLPAGEDPFRQFIEGVQDYAICLLDRDGRIQTWNPGAELMQGWKSAEVVGQPFSVLYPEDPLGQGRPLAALEGAAQAGRIEDEGWLLRKGGSRFWGLVGITALHDQDGEVYGYAVITRDVTDKRLREDELRRTLDRSRRFWAAAITDPLTGAYNRRYLTEHLRGEIDRGEIPTASMVLFDIDHFKAINDRHGHDAGDLVLRNVASVARQMSRESDRLFRLGGDEFVLYLPGVNAAGARSIAQRLRDAVTASTPPGTTTVTISIGVAERVPQQTLDEWLRAADVALYEAKQAGRNRVV